MNYERANHRWDQARDAHLTDMWAEGVPIADIAVRMFTTVGAIADRRHHLGLSPRKGPSGWTDDRVETAKRLWIEGKSAKQIAMILNCGLSRNAVIGKIHRLGMSQQGRAACAAPAQSRRRGALSAPKVARSHIRPPKPGPQNRPALILGPYSTASDSQRVERAAEGQAANAKVTAGGGVESPNARPWMERRPGECSWPVGLRYEIKSCCNPVHARGWCEGHFAVGTAEVQPQGPRDRDASRLTRFDRVERDGPMPRANNAGSAWDEGRLVA